MRFLWCDTETTGISTEDSGAFEIGLILVDNGKKIGERVFFLNPLSETIKFHEDAAKIHGYTEEKIKGFLPEVEAVKDIEKFLRDARELFREDSSCSEKMIFAGYNCDFDWNHLQAILNRHGYKMGDYFTGVKADVFTQVKKAGMKKALPYLPNRKLGTICEHLGVDLEKAHDALADIKATRLVAVKLHRLGVELL